MSVKDIYYYFFYKFYKIAIALKSRVLTKTKAAIVMTALETWLWFSFLNYYDFAKHRFTNLTLFSPAAFLPLILIILLKWVAFLNDNRSDFYIKKFDTWPKSKNSKGTLLVITTAVLILVNLIFSNYLRAPQQFKW